jgi:exosortase
MKIDRKTAIALMLLIICFLLLYRHVGLKLVHDWATDDNYSHGFLIIPLACYFAWERRESFVRATRQPSNFGYIIVICSSAVLLAGVLGSELFLTRISMLGAIAGIILALFGWEYLWIASFPLGFLILMIPIPTILFNQIAFPLQLLASRFGEAALIACGIPVLREGNVINLANTSLEVAEACSGIRSLVSLLTLGIVYGYFTESRTALRIMLAIATIPVAIAANGIRVAGTGIAAHFYGPEAARGFFHTFSGWIVFIAAFLMLFILHRIILLISPSRLKRQDIANS